MRNNGPDAHDRRALARATTRLDHAVHAGKQDVARKAAAHIDDAIQTLVELMHNAKRGNVRLQASCALLRFAAESEALADERTQVFVLAASESTQGLAAQLRERLRSGEE